MFSLDTGTKILQKSFCFILFWGYFFWVMHCPEQGMLLQLYTAWEHPESCWFSFWELQLNCHSLFYNWPTICIPFRYQCLDKTGHFRTWAVSKKETLLLSDRNQVDDLWWNKVFILLSSPLLVKQKGTEPKCLYMN